MQDLDADNYDPGFNTLWTNLDYTVDPFEVEVMFDEAGDAYLAVSFNFVSGGWNASEKTTVAAGYGGDFAKSSASFDIGLGSGNRSWRDQLDDTATIGSNDPDIFSGPGSDHYKNTDVQYYNHATNANLTTEQEDALRSWVTTLSDDTPHIAMTSDTDGGDTRQYDDQSFNRITDGHATWLESNGSYMFNVPQVETSSDRASANVWTDDSYAFYTGGGSTGSDPGSNAGIADITTELIIPETVYLDIRTGGGPCFGTPYSANANQGAGNMMNNRPYFLVRG